jgi:hypothetical protein
MDSCIGGVDLQGLSPIDSESGCDSLTHMSGCKAVYEWTGSEIRRCEWDKVSHTCHAAHDTYFLCTGGRGPNEGGFGGPFCKVDGFDRQPHPPSPVCDEVTPLTDLGSLEEWCGTDPIRRASPTACESAYASWCEYGNNIVDFCSSDHDNGSNPPTRKIARCRYNAEDRSCRIPPSDKYGTSCPKREPPTFPPLPPPSQPPKSPDPPSSMPFMPPFAPPYPPPQVPLL